MTSVDNTFELWRRFALYDDEPAFKELFFAYSNPLKRFPFPFLTTKKSAEEVVCDVFQNESHIDIHLTKTIACEK